MLRFRRRRWRWGRRGWRGGGGSRSGLRLGEGLLGLLAYGGNGVVVIVDLNVLFELAVFVPLFNLDEVLWARGVS